MGPRFKFYSVVLLAVMLGVSQAAQAAIVGLPMNLKYQFERIKLDAPALPPMAHIKFCMTYPQDCRSTGMVFRGGGVELTADRYAELVKVNAEVNRSIVPTRNTRGVVAEEWLVGPSRGDCNDYAVTKRHALLQRGWPARALLLAEVVTSWGEHHLVLVVRTRSGDLVVDNLNANVRPWAKANYRWVRVQSPSNPRYWSSVAGSAA
ncbi:transglutaminase-like cysteine peptidase [Bradyrhizobium sp. HKCCYLS2038]|uniref:transglutaminase-like cysteine peptidase n=1 Tax=unclassified Bradyrhizobium TaxID=2631580 RepID=UPI003EBA1725